MAQGAVGNSIAQLVAEHEGEILAEWLHILKAGGALASGRLKEAELQTQARTLLGLLRTALAAGGTSPDSPVLAPVKDWLGDLSRSRAIQGFSPTETATFVLSLKHPLFNLLDRTAAPAPPPANLTNVTPARPGIARIGPARDAPGRDGLTRDAWEITVLLDGLGLYAMEVYQRSREEVIVRQQRELAELSTPVVKLWAGILALPLIGTLDSERTQVVMENLLHAIVAHGAEVAIIDITGVPTVDTLTAQHLLKTVAAARLMGADCIISGIRPQIAQTMVHLGVELDVTSKASLADAFAVALDRVGRAVVAKPRAQPTSG